MNRNADGDFKFNLGNFENDWNDDNCLLCFCDSSDFSRHKHLSLGGSFLLQALFPTAELSADFIEKQYELPVFCMVEHLVFPTYLKEEFENIILPNSLRH